MRILAPFARLVTIVAATLITLLASMTAAAAGRVEWKAKKVQERDDKSWRLEVAIYMPKAPDVAHVPMKFEFQPMVYFARDLVEGDKIVERKVPIDDRQPIIESVDVGFLDAGSGKIEPRTRFSFKVTRAHGYEAGEYKVTIRDTRNGQTVGTATTLTFEGENETVDRRPMVFTSDKKKKDKDKAAEGDEAKKDEEKKDEAGGEEKKAEASEEGAKSEGEAEGEKEAAGEGEEPQTIKEKPGGCGCRIEDTKRPGHGSALVIGLALGSLALRRRKRQAA